MKNMLITGTVATLIGATLSAGIAQADTTLRFGHVLETSHPLAKKFKQVADEVEEQTNGEVKIKLFPASTLGNQAELVEGLSLGTVDITAPGSAFLGSTMPEIAITSAPYIFRDIDHFSAFTKSDVFSELAENYYDETNNHILSMWYYGSRHLTTNEPVREPEAAEGMKIRVPNAPVYAMFPESIGANPTPISFSEVYLALQQGVIDGQENPLPVIQAKRFYEVQEYINLTGHLIDNLMPIISGSTWQNLSDEHQKVVASAFIKAAEETIDVIAQEEERLKEELSNNGINVIEVDKEAFAQAAQPLLEASDNGWSPELYQAIQDIK